MSESSDYHIGIVSEPPVHILENDYVNFESNVLAEEKIKAQGLQKLRSARSLSETEVEAAQKQGQSVTASPSSSLLQVKEETKEEVEEEEVIGNDVQQQFFKSIVKYPVSTEFQRVHITKTDRPVEPDTAAASAILLDCMQLRNKWINAHPSPPQDKESIAVVSIGTPDAHRRKGLGQDDVYRRRRDLLYDVFSSPILPSVAHMYTTEMKQGVIRVVKLDIPSAPAAGDTNIHVSTSDGPGYDANESVFTVLPFEEFVRDMYTVKKGVFFGPTGSYSFHCLEVLSAKFHLHTLLNSTIETEAQKLVPHRDFYNIRKVDTHVHHSACMNQKHLLRFIKNKLKTCPNEVFLMCYIVCGMLG